MAPSLIGFTFVTRWHLITLPPVTGRLAFADRGRYIADTDFVTVPVQGMLDKNYLATRAALITDNDFNPAEPQAPRPETSIRRRPIPPDSAALEAALITHSHSVGVIAQESGLSIIQVGRHSLIGSADYRRDGTVAGR